MTKFSRRIDTEPLQRLADSPEPNWWKDLLSLWAPARRARGDRRLRLAVRDGYLNFYLRGQSVARVHIAKGGVPVAEVHVKYAFENAEGQSYTRLTGTDVMAKVDMGAYAGVATLREWMARAAGYESEEKALVERVINDNRLVIDVEMGLPAHEGQASALRMDIVALEPSGAGAKIIFWEAKQVSDGRLRTASPDGEPEVMRQLNGYRAWLQSLDHRQQVVEAYTETRRLLDVFAHMAGLKALFKPGEPASGPLSVDPEPRLLVFGTREELGRAAWAPHCDKLKGYGVPMHMVATDTYVLPPANALAVTG